MPLIDALPNRFVGQILATFGADDEGDHQCFIVAFDRVDHRSSVEQLGFQDVRDLDPGHPA